MQIDQCFVFQLLNTSQRAISWNSIVVSACFFFLLEKTSSLIQLSEFYYHLQVFRVTVLASAIIDRIKGSTPALSTDRRCAWDFLLHCLTLEDKTWT